jgi:DNA-binding CsgD family transcriptional regulator
LPQTEKMTSLSTGTAAETRLFDGARTQRLSVERAPAPTYEAGAAISHELNGLVTALLFHIGHIQRNSDRLVDAGKNAGSLKQAVEGAFHVADRICSLTHRMDDFFEAPMPKEAPGAGANDVRAWSDANGHDGESPHEPDRLIEEPSRTTRPLTRREREVLRLVSEGCSNKEGAKLMNISHRTFECHRAEVMRKLGARNTAELVRLVLMDGNGLAPSLEQTGASRGGL